MWEKGKLCLLQIRVPQTLSSAYGSAGEPQQSPSNHWPVALGFATPAGLGAQIARQTHLAGEMIGADWRTFAAAPQ